MVNIISDKDSIKQEEFQENFQVEDNSHNAFLLIPAYVADHPKIDDSTAILYGRLNALSNKVGYCFASDKYLAGLAKVSLAEIKKRLKALEDEGLIQRFTNKLGMKWERKIYTSNNYFQIKFTKGSYGAYRRVHTEPIEGSTRSPYIYKTTNTISTNKREVASDEARMLSCFLFDKLKKKNPKQDRPIIDNWAKDIDRMMKAKKLSAAEIKAVINWAFQEGGKFWPVTIQSPTTLRKLYDRAVIEMNNKPKDSGASSEELSLIAKVHAKYLKYRDESRDMTILNNCLMLSGQRMWDSRNENFKTKTTTGNYLDKLFTGGYVNGDSFRIVAKIELLALNNYLKKNN